MNHAKAKERIAKLRQLISEYRYEYHVKNRSIMSEAAADSLKHELAQLEEEHPDLITPDSPTQRVAGEPLPGFVSVAHAQPMLSLNDVFDQEEVEAWQLRVQKLAPGAKLEYFADIKMDGLACSIVYQDGAMMRAVTRGNGQTGEDVTANVRTIESVPLRLRESKEFATFLKGRTEVRGEIVMHKKDFAHLNERRAQQGLPEFANPRNLAAGSIRQLDPKLAAKRPLHFVAWEILRDDPSEILTQEFAYQAIRELGVNSNIYAEVLSDIKSVMKFVHKWAERRHDLPFNTDGLVIKINDRQLYSQLGVVGKAPRAAVAYKYPAEQSTTKVKDIFISIGRTGAATPVAMLDPVVVAGTTVQMATLHNEGEVHRKDIRVGDTVIIHKAGDIIPEVVESLAKLRTGQEKPFVMPKTCPECSTELIKFKEEEAVWRCPNPKCPARVQNLIQHYASRAALDIEGLGEKNVLALLEAKLVKDPSDLYSLTKNQVMGLERFAEISAGKLVDNIQAKKNPSLAHFLYALGIRHVGAQTATDLANHFGALKALSEATIDQLQEVEGVGAVVAESVVAWFASETNQQLLAKFAKLGVDPQKVAKTESGALAGQGFVITGTLNSMEREAAADKIRALGGTFQSSVGKNTSYVVVGNNPGASKITKAEKLDVPQISEEDLIKILKG